MFLVLPLLALTVSARIFRTESLPADVEEWINQINEVDENVDWKHSKAEMGAEDQSAILPPDVDEWVENVDKKEKKRSCCHSKAEVLAEDQPEILPPDVVEWVENVDTEEKKRSCCHSKAEITPEDQIEILPSQAQLSAEKVGRPSDCSIAVSLWKKMGKETALDPNTISPTGCCHVGNDYKESGFDHIRCEGENIVHIDWRYNHLQGSLPKEICMLEHLKELYFSDNDMTGSIPPEISDCKNMLYLDLANNNFTGTIPPEMGKMKNLGYLFFWNNDLEGSIPNEFGALDKLVSFGVSGNPKLNTEVLPEQLQIRKDAWDFWIW